VDCWTSVLPCEGLRRERLSGRMLPPAFGLPWGSPRFGVLIC